MNEPSLRKDMDSQWMWDLTAILKDKNEFNALFQQFETEAQAFCALSGKIAENPADAVKSYFTLHQKIETLYVYAKMNLDQDGSDSESQDMMTRVQGAVARTESATAFFRPELLTLPDDALKALSLRPDCAEYSVFLEDILRDKPHTLSRKEERLLALSGEMFGAPSDIFTMLSDVEMPFPMVHDEEGNEIRLSGSTYSRFLHSRKREVRKEAYESMMNAYNAFRSTYASAYRYSVKGDVISARARNFDSAIAASLFPDRIPVSLYDTLLDSVNSALPALNKYLKLRQKKLGLSELHLYDLYVPIVEGFDIKLTYPEAFRMVKKGLAPLGPHYAELLDEAYQNRWIDVYENRGKHSGAYSWGVYGSHPYVLLNFTGDLNGATTLAHELGHAMHTWHSNHALPYAKAGYSLFVAEVASTCNEMLLMRSLMKDYKDNPAASAFLLNQLLEEFRTTVFRQTMFAAFERESHRMEEEGIPLTADSLAHVHEDLNRRFYGESCVIDEAVRSEWMRIPHFYTAFYVYKYATGFSAAVAIANRILTEGQPAVDDYMKFLSAGGSVPPLDALRLAGVDMEDPATVRNALQVFADAVDELEVLL